MFLILSHKILSGSFLIDLYYLPDILIDISYVPNIFFSILYT